MMAAEPPGPLKERISAMEVYVPGVVPSRAMIVPWALKALLAIVASYLTEMLEAGQQKTPPKRGFLSLPFGRILCNVFPPSVFTDALYQAV